MGIFNRKKSSADDQLEGMVETLKKIITRESKLAAIFLTKTTFGGTAFIQGDASDIHKALIQTAKEDTGFASIIKMVARELGAGDMDPRMPQELKDILDNKKTSGVVDIPGVGKAIAIDPKNIDSLSEKDIDDIIDGIIDSIKPNDKKD